MRRWPALLTLLALAAAPALALDDPRQDPYFANPALRDLMDWACFRLSFEAESFVPDMAAGDYKFSVTGTPRFAPGVKGQALVAGGPEGSGAAVFPRGGNAPFETRGAVALWFCDAGWTHTQGGNTTLLMTSNATFYLQRQGPWIEGAELKRAEGLQYLVFGPATGSQCLMYGTNGFKPGEWHLLVANWSWPTMTCSLDGGEFQSTTTKAPPAPDQFGALCLGATGGEKTLMDELIIFRRPLSLAEVKALYEALRGK